MTTVIEVPKEYGYVVFTAVGSILLGMWHGIRITPFRRAAGVPHPNYYAPVGKDRAHAHYLENYPFFITALLVGGLKYPVLSSGLGLAWMGFRIVYAIGYTSPDKERGRGRLPGLLSVVPQVLLGCVSLKIGYDLITS